MAEFCYVPQYRPASFKGVAFICVEADSDHGRRGAEGEFPFGENTAYADLGRRIRHYKLKGAYRTNDHIAQMGRLIAACESPGPGILVHPTRGSVRVACKHLRVQDNLESGIGETTFDIEFVEANDWVSGFNFGQSIASIDLSPILQATAATFAALYRPAEYAYFVEPAITGAARQGVGRLHDALLLGAGIREDRVFWRVAADLQTLASDPTKVRDPDQAWLGLAGGFTAVDRYARTPEDKLTAFRSMANWAALFPRGPVSAQAAIDAVITAARVMSAGYMARASIEQTPRTLQDALTQYDRVATILTQETQIARAACDNVLFMAIREFQAKAQVALLNRAYNLPAIVQYNFHTGVSPLVAAHEIYGDARQHRLIERYNPGALPFLVGPIVTAPRNLV